MASRASSASSSIATSCSRASSSGCSEKNAVDSLMWDTTFSIALTVSSSVARPRSDRPWPLSYTLRITSFKGSVILMPWRASAILELPLKV